MVRCSLIQTVKGFEIILVHSCRHLRVQLTKRYRKPLTVP
jgi:hypothetical protein